MVQPMLQGSHCNVTTDLAEQMQSAHALVIHLCSLIPEEIIQEVKKGKVRSLLFCGFTAWTTGLKPRPAFPKQGQVFRADFQHSDIFDRRLAWNKRQQRAHVAMKKIRQSRRS